MIDPDRVRRLKRSTGDQAGPVVYWMSRDQRASDNWALLWAQELALKAKQPMLVVFCLAPSFLGATLRQYDFMLKGLEKVEKKTPGQEHQLPAFDRRTGRCRAGFSAAIKSFRAGH